MAKSKIFIAVLLLFITITFEGCTGNLDEKSQGKVTEITVFAATSLTEALTEIQWEYNKNHNIRILFNFGASGTLQKQIQQEAPCDLYISASEENMDLLEETGYIVASSRKDLVGNTLSLIASKEKSKTITGLESLTESEVGSLSIGTPENVPSGKYARQSLENQGVWNRIQEKLVFGKDVKQVLEYVETGNVDCGLVYQTDAMVMKTGRIICDMPEDSHSPIIYQVALMRGSGQQVPAGDFLEFLLSDYSDRIFEKYGFKTFVNDNTY